MKRWHTFGGWRSRQSQAARRSATALTAPGLTITSVLALASMMILSAGQSLAASPSLPDRPAGLQLSPSDAPTPDSKSARTAESAAEALPALDAAIAGKLDATLAGIVRRQQASQQAAFNGAAVTKAADGKLQARVFVRLAGPNANAEAMLQAAGGQVGSRAADVVTATVPVSKLARLAADPDVAYLEAARELNLTLDVSVPEIQANLVHDGTPPSPGAHQGEGVIVGIIDSGIDWTHSDFRNEDGTSRVLTIWDQVDGGGPAPTGFSYGTEWTKADIDDDLDGTPAGVVRHTDTVGHGTHVAGIAAGDGSAPGSNVGVAPLADIIVVKTTQVTTDVVDAVNYIFTRAEAEGKPAVVNISLGSNWGPHDNTSAYETGLNNLAGPGRIICMAAGNAGDNFVDVGETVWATHSGYTNTPTWKWTMLQGFNTFDVDMWNEGGVATVSVHLYEMVQGSLEFREATPDVAPGGSGTWTLTDGPSAVGDVTIDSTETSNPFNNAHHIVIHVQRLASPVIFNRYYWRIWSKGSGVMDMWVPVTETAAFYPLTGSQPVDAAKTVHGGATAAKVIAVGSYVTKTGGASQVVGDISDFSSIGPSRKPLFTGVKPEIAAPGELILSTCSAQVCGSVNQFEEREGTSMAAPHVAGTVALMLERYPLLEPDVSVVLLKSAEEFIIDGAATDVFTGAIPNDVWGYGKLRTLGAIEDVPTDPGVVGQPSNQSVCLGDSAQFCIGAVGTPPLSYQWQWAPPDQDNWQDILGAAESCYTVESATTDADGRRFRCEVTNGNGDSEFSEPGVLALKPGTTVTDQPEDQDICPDGTATFTITSITSGPAGYQWQKYDAGLDQWDDLADEGKFSGATTASLQVSNVDETVLGDYRCVVTGECGTDTSEVVSLTIKAVTEIAADPEPQDICPGTTATFTVDATGEGTLFYQWQANTTGIWQSISGEITDTLNIPNVDAGDVGQYRCRVTAECGDAESAAAPLTLKDVTVITGSPVDLEVCAGSPAGFSVSATGEGTLSYLWQRFNEGSGTWENLANGGRISGAASPDLMIADTIPADASRYRCQVTGECTTEISDEAELFVDEFPTFTIQPADVNVCETEAVSFEVEAAGGFLSYQWEVSTNGGGNWDDVPGATSPQLQFTASAGDDNNQYRCQVTNLCGTATSDIVALTIKPETEIITDPSDQRVCLDGTASFSVDAVGAGNLVYQWEANVTGPWQAIPGATSSTLVRSPVTADMVGDYRCRVTGDCGIVHSAPASLMLKDETQIVQDPDDQSVCPGGTAVFGVSADGEGTFSYQWETNASGSWQDIPGATDSTVSVMDVQAGDLGEYRCRVTADCGTVTSGSATLSLKQATVVTDQPDDQDLCPGDTATFTVAAIGQGAITFQWQTNTSGDWANIPGATSDTLNVSNVDANDVGDYRCLLTAGCGQAFSDAASLTLKAETIITSHPQGDDVCPGEEVVFTVAANGEGTLTYQWQTDKSGPWQDIAGANAETLTLPDVASEDAGRYRCRVTGECGQATSNPATLSVKVLTAIFAPPSDQDVCLGGSATFSVVAVGEGTLTYQWEARTNGVWEFVQDATSSTLNLSPVTADMVGEYRCRVTGGCSVATSNAASLTLKDETQITADPVNQNVCPGGTAAFTVSAAGDGDLSYQWETDASGNWMSVPGGVEATLTLNGVDASDVGNYRCVVTGDCGSDTSGMAALSLKTQTTITLQPEDTTVCPDGTVVLSVEAEGTNLSYQWQKFDTGSDQWLDLTDETETMLTISNATANEAGDYRVVVSGDCNGQLNSEVATVIVAAETSIAEDPQDVDGCAGGTVDFTVTAIGVNLQYQWQIDTGSGFVDIPSAPNEATYTTPPIAPEDDGNKYRCIVSGDCDSAGVTSGFGTLTIVEDTVISGNPPDKAVCPGATATFVVTASGNDLQYQWQLDPGDGFINIPGATESSYTTPEATPGDDGNRYRCTVIGTCGTEVSNIATLTLNVPTEVTDQPDATVICSGFTATFEVTAVGTDVTYQWQTQPSGGGIWTNIGGANASSYTTPALDIAEDGRQYRCEVTGACGTVHSDPATVSVTDETVLTDQPDDVTKCPGETAMFSVIAEGAGLTYLWQINQGTWADIPGATSSSYTTPALTGADDGNQYRCRVTGTCGQVFSDPAVLTMNPPTVVTDDPDDAVRCDGETATFTVAATGQDLSYEWQVDTGGGFAAIGGAPDGPSYTTTALTTAEDGNLYRCVVTGVCGSTASGVALLTVNATTAIVDNPNDVVTSPGETAQYVVVAIGGGLSYQWQVDTGGGFADIIGAPDAPTYTTPALTLDDSGNKYRCVVTGNCGQATSEAGNLTVIPSAPVSVVEWRSVRDHGGTPLSITLDNSFVGAVATTDPRLGGIQRIEVDFDGPAGSVSGTIEAEDLTHGGSTAASDAFLINGNQTLVIEFAGGLNDRTCWRIDLDGLVLTVTGDTDCQMRGLVADVSSNGTVNLIDAAEVKGRNGQSPTIPGNVLYDVNADGVINLIDFAVTKGLNGTAASCAPPP